ncbi:MAG: hypothetical protein AAF226_01520 [Verrucomicrobiota bacterium]
MASLTIQIPEQAQEIENLQETVEWFVEEQIKLNEWRKKRYTPEVNSLVEEVFQDAALLREDGVSTDTTKNHFNRLTNI